MAQRDPLHSPLLAIITYRRKYRRISEKFSNNFSRLRRAVTSFTRAMVKNTCSNTLNDLRLPMTLSLLPNPWSHSCWGPLQHSLKKFASRVNKRYNKFMDFVQKLEKHLAIAPPAEQHLRDAWDTLLQVKRIINYVYRKFLATSSESLDYSELVASMGALQMFVGVLTKSSCTILWPEVVEGKKSLLITSTLLTS